MNARLETRLLGYSIIYATNKAGRPRRKKRGNADVWAVCAGLAAVALAVAVVWPMLANG